MTRNPSFLQSLVAEKILREDELHKLSLQFNQNAYEILMHLVTKAGYSKESLGKLWGDSLGVTYVPTEKSLFQRDVVLKISREFASKNNIILMYQMGNVITAACSNPTNYILIENAALLAGAAINPVFSFPEDIQDAIQIQYVSGNSLKDLSVEIATHELIKNSVNITLEQLRNIAGDSAMIKLTDDIILLAIKERASDIHIESTDECVRIRFRVDGALQEFLTLDKTLLSPLVSRLKILADLDIAEKRRPQDGRISFAMHNMSIDIRFSCVPAIYGEKIALRLLGQGFSKEIPKLENLQCSKSVYAKIKKALGSPNGIFLATGPTGSGKTTTLFSALQYLNSPDINIMTIEDPVEYRLDGVNQLQVNREIALDFASALRAFLRQDPDVILIGEIRDLETARIAAQAALTGHLVLATMHTNSSLQAITRLIDIGVEPFLVASSIIGVMAQRLVRRICNHCKEKYKPPEEKIHEMFLWDGKQEVFFYRGKGCLSCNNTGYYGRIAIHEVFIINDEIRNLVSHNASILEIQKTAEKCGYQDLRYDGIKKALRGLTTIDEIDSVTFSDYSERIT